MHYQPERGARTTDRRLDVGQHAADDRFFLNGASQRDGKDFDRRKRKLAANFTSRASSGAGFRKHSFSPNPAVLASVTT